MGKKGGSKKLPTARNPSQTKGVGRDSKSFLKVEHLQKLAEWASGEASIPSLAAFFGRRLAASREDSGIPPDPNLVSCQRCETILQPGFNCTVRIEKISSKARCRRKKPGTNMQNNVVYNCHFCSHRNLRRGTPKGYMKELCPPKAKQKQATKPKPSKPLPQNANLKNVTGSKEATLPPVSGETSIVESPATPSIRSGTSLLDAKKRKRNKSASKKSEGSESNITVNKDETPVAASNKRRKSWMSLKEKTENNERSSSRNFGDLSIPFFI